MLNELNLLWQSGGLPLFLLIGIAGWAVGLVVHDSLAMALGVRLGPSTLPILAVLAAIAPLVGLLGTVMGLVLVFTTNLSPDLVARGISRALLTTQIGLIIAVPILFARQMLLRWRERRLAKGAA